MKLSRKYKIFSIWVYKKIIKKTKWLVVYGDFILSLTNNVVPSQPIGLPIFPTTLAIMRSIHSDADLLKKVIIARVSNNRPDKMYFTKKQIDPFYDVVVKFRNNFLTKEKLITKLKGGGIEN